MANIVLGSCIVDRSITVAEAYARAHGMLPSNFEPYLFCGNPDCRRIRHMSIRKIGPSRFPQTCYSRHVVDGEESTELSSPVSLPSDFVDACVQLYKEHVPIVYISRRLHKERTIIRQALIAAGIKIGMGRPRKIQEATAINGDAA